MQIGMIGLGRMGANMVRRLLRGGHTAVVFDPDQARGRRSWSPKAPPAPRRSTSSWRSSSRRRRRGAWCRPATITEQTVRELGARLGKGDAIIDGGNTFFKDDVRRVEGAGRQGHRLHRRRHQRRRVGPRARLLPDDRRAGGSVRAARADLQDPRARQGDDRHDARASTRRRTCRPRRRRAICTAVRPAPATSSRWSTTASSTA